MIHLPKRKSTFNFFEAFSDLVFCTLVMFLVLILFLAINVNQKAVAVEEDQEAVTQEIAAIEQQRDEAEVQLQATLADADAKRQVAEQERLRAERERLEAERQRMLAQQRADAEAERARLAAIERQQIEASLAQRQNQLDQMRDEVELERQRYEEALGTRRFEGLPPRPRLVVAYQWEPRRILVHPVPAWFNNKLNTSPPGLTGQALTDHYTALRAEFLELSSTVPPLTARQYRELIRAMSVGIEPIPAAGAGDAGRRGSMDVAFAVDSDGKPTTAIAVLIPGGNAQAAGVELGDVLLAVGETGATPENLGALLSGLRVGDTARLLLRRGGKPVVVQVPLRAVEPVEVGEAFRTDLSMVVSGALDASYNYLWEPALADALRERLQQGQAGPTVWQNHSRRADRGATRGRPVLLFDVDDRRQEVLIGPERLSPAQFRRVLEALSGGGLVIEYAARFGPRELPDWLTEQVMQPTGFVNRAPNLELLEQEADGAAGD